MELLKQKIRTEGTVIDNRILKVDSFLNHQIDPLLMKQMGEEFARRFQNSDITKILTVESSGIAVGVATGMALQVPVLFARKMKSAVMNDDVYSASVYSYTKDITNEITVSKRFLPPGERVLIVDDFLANGAAALGMTSLVEQAGCTVSGIGIVIEKSFQPGAAKLAQAGYIVESLVRIQSFSNGQVIFV